tara:strand:+ start:2375 stop:2953 length:579 start_codon:yes stop_codon:yes gene_type:complete
MIRIGIIGDIGSGKSHVAKQFGGPVFNADYEVARLYRKNRKCYKKLRKILPSYITSFPVKKSFLNLAIEENPKNLKKITDIIHPEIRYKMNNFIKRNKNKKFIVLDIPLLIENKINRKNDVLIFVDASKREIYKRLRKRPNFDPKIIKKLKKLQLPIETKKKKSNFIIKNNFKNKSLKKNVKRILDKIILYA